MSSQGLGTAFAALVAFSTDAVSLTIALIFLMLFGTFLPMQCCCKKKKRKGLVRPQPAPAAMESPSPQQQTGGQQQSVKKVVKKPSEESSKKEGPKSKSIKGPEMIDERKEERKKQLVKTAVGLPKMKNDKHDEGMADGCGYMTLDKLDRNIFVRDLPKLTPKLGPPKMVDESPKQKGVADGAEYQTLGKLDVNIFKTAKVGMKKAKPKKITKSKPSLDKTKSKPTLDRTKSKPSLERTRSKPSLDTETGESEETEGESSVDRTKSEEKTVDKNKKKRKTSKEHAKKHHKTGHKDKKKHHHHHKKSSSKKDKSKPKLKEDKFGKKEGMAEGYQYETLNSLDRNIFTQHSVTKSSPSFDSEDDD